MIGSLFADISDEDKEAMAWVPPTILTDLENIVEHALTNYEVEKTVNLSDGVQFYNKMYFCRCWVFICIFVDSLYFKCIIARG